MKKIITLSLVFLFVTESYVCAYDPLKTPIATENNFSNLPEINSSKYNETNLTLNPLNENVPQPTEGATTDYNKTTPSTSPSSNYSTMFPTSKDTQNKEDTPMVGNDGLPTNGIKDSVEYYNNMGSVRIEKKVDENGRTYYVDSVTGKPVDINTYKVSSKYETAKKEYYDALAVLNKLKADLTGKNKKLTDINKKISKTTDSVKLSELNTEKTNLENQINDLMTQITNQEAVVNEKLVAYKNAKFKELDKAGYNTATIYNSSGNVRKQAVANGAAFGSSKLMSEPYKDYNTSTSENDFVKQTVKESKKVNEAYNETYGIDIDKLAKDSPVMADKNVTNIINAYKAVDAITEQAKNRLSNNYIKCYVSRELIPAYYCPLPGLDANTYPDYSHVTSIKELEEAINTGPDDAKATCDSICQQKFSCVNYKILNNTDFNASNSTYTIYPRNDYSNPYKIEIPLDDRMAINGISFTVKINPNLTNYKPEEHDGMDFDKYYISLGKTVKIKMDAYAYFNDKPAVPLAKDMVVEIKNGTIVKVNLNANMAMDKLILYFKKPYIYSSQFL